MLVSDSATGHGTKLATSPDWWNLGTVTLDPTRPAGLPHSLPHQLAKQKSLSKSAISGRAIPAYATDGPFLGGSQSQAEDGCVHSSCLSWRTNGSAGKRAPARLVKGRLSAFENSPGWCFERELSISFGSLYCLFALFRKPFVCSSGHLLLRLPGQGQKRKCAHNIRNRVVLCKLCHFLVL